jgi:hypothetical protein
MAGLVPAIGVFDIAPLPDDLMSGAGRHDEYR